MSKADENTVEDAHTSKYRTVSQALFRTKTKRQKKQGKDKSYTHKQTHTQTTNVP